jgi:hypothetical protein
MTPEAALIELLERIGAEHGAAVLVSEHKLSEWSGAAVAAMKSHRLISQAHPANSAVCPGCERECVMPVHVLPHPIGPAAFIVCDKRSDINRVALPVSRLERWQASGSSIADLLAGLLELHRSGSGGADASRWEVGMLKGAKHSSHLVLVADGGFTLSLGGHSVALADVLGVDGDRLAVDRRTLNRLVDQPVAGAGDTESAAQRRERIKKRVQAEKAKGTKAFLKAVAEEEGISVTRLKQLL